MCGATSQQKSLEASQAKFYDTMTQQYQTVFGKQQAILDTLTKVFQPIFDKGPSQRGFSTEEHTALDTGVTESVAANYANTRKQVDENIAARGGNDFIPSGAEAQIDAGLSETASNERASLENKVEMSDWETGRQVWQAAAQGLGATAAQENPVGFANATTGAGSAASETANEIAMADNSVWGSVIGGLSGIAGQAVGGWAGKKKG